MTPPPRIKPHHVTALHKAHALHWIAARAGKPHAAWARHTQVGGARVADALVALGYLEYSIDSRPGRIETCRYRITAAGCAYLAQPFSMEEPAMTASPALADTPKPPGAGYDPVFDQIVGYDEDDPEYRPPVDKPAPAPTPAEMAELRADREQLLSQQADYERQVKALREQLAAVKAAIADDASADDPAAAVAALKLHAADQAETIDAQHKAILNMRAQLEVAAQEADVMKKDVVGLKLQIVNLANGGEIGVQHERTDRTTPAEITARVLAGWTPWHKFSDGPDLSVIWERTPKGKARATRDRGVSRPVPTASAAPTAVLQPDRIVIPADLPANPTDRHAAPPPDPAEPLNPMSAVMASFTRNLRAQLDANPIPQPAVTPGAKQPARLA